MSKKYLDKNGLSHLWSKLKDYFQVKLVSGTNIKTINNTSLLGSGNIPISIPTKTSELTNDAGFITRSEVIRYVEMEKVSHSSQTDKAWENVGLSITVPANHIYIVQAQQVYNNTRPLGIGFHVGSTLESYFTRPLYSIASDNDENCGWGTFMLTPRTWTLWGKQNTAGRSNNYYVKYVDICLG